MWLVPRQPRSHGLWLPGASGVWARPEVKYPSWARPGNVSQSLHLEEYRFKDNKDACRTQTLDLLLLLIVTNVEHL